MFFQLLFYCLNRHLNYRNFLYFNSILIYNDTSFSRHFRSSDLVINNKVSKIPILKLSSMDTQYRLPQSNQTWVLQLLPTSVLKNRFELLDDGSSEWTTPSSWVKKWRPRVLRSQGMVHRKSDQLYRQPKGDWCVRLSLFCFTCYRKHWIRVFIIW